MGELRVLMVEDSEEDALLLLRALERAGYDVTAERVETAPAMREALQRQWDVVISDCVMPGFSGLDALDLARQRDPDLPVMLVSGQLSEETAVEAMRAGARDFVTKGNLSRLAPAIQRELREAEMRRERRRMEMDLQRAQKLEMAGSIAGYVAHDFNNLLTPMAGYAELLKRRLSRDTEGTELCDTIIAMARQMAEINGELLTLARRGRADADPLDLNDVVKRAAGLISTTVGSDITVQLDLAPDPLVVNGSEAQLARAISNLLANARDALPVGGRLCLSTNSVTSERPLGGRGQVPPGRYVTVEVSDTGCGIPPEIIDKVFEPFFSTKKPDQKRGSGLGLSVVQAIVSDHGGYIDLLSEPGRGTRVTLFLPASEEAIAEDEPVEDVVGGSESILVVDDDPILGSITRDMLEALGYKVTVSAGGEEALEFLRAEPADLLVLDMTMPGLDGADTYREALKLRPGQRAIVVSGSADPERLRLAQALGAGAYLPRPLRLEDLGRAVRQELDGAQVSG